MRDKTGKGTGLLVNKPEKYMDSKTFIVSVLTDSWWNQMPWAFCKRKWRIPASASLNNLKE